MGQVPQATYLLIGNGRLAGHMSHYFHLEKIPHQRWHRQSRTPIEAALADASHILVLISDDAIEPFVRQHATGHGKTWVHCSGSLDTDLAIGAHPLMTFAPGHYDLETYRRIPFVCDREGPSFSELFPKLTNPCFSIDRRKKALYHALCVMGGNFSTLLWKKVTDTFAGELDLPPEILHPYMERTLENIKVHDAPLTGPLARRDMGTIRKNLRALSDNPFEKVYRAFVASMDIELENEILEKREASR
jgi:predicted short-subunit dehydrogenase-like oxidoreductase (DUF2520 family)